uniref:ribosomal protein L35 n=1 Tax=Rhodaphanes brevistipitata TaxID=446136 RepID=UPI001FCD27E7|nr:ribosomal protein L35 [Rhodaphanes brevistipitata]UNJ18480.1 ribosomal protein L35 [Rhodaphanes brevistipitata]
MPKIKTCRAIAKRFRVTANKKFLRRKSGKNHLLEKKTQDRKRNLRKRTSVNLRDINNVISRLPYI